MKRAETDQWRTEAHKGYDEAENLVLARPTTPVLNGNRIDNMGLRLASCHTQKLLTTAVVVITHFWMNVDNHPNL